MSKFGSERTVVLRWIRFIVVWIRSIWPTFCIKSVEPCFSFLTV